MNLLFTSAGRRGYLLDYFRDALDGDGEIHATNSSDNAPAFLHADHHAVSPLIYSADYIDFVCDYCATHRIDAIIPLFDIDVPVLARASERIAAVGTRLVSSNSRIAHTCNDKLATIAFFDRYNFRTPRTYSTLPASLAAVEQQEVAFPLVLKPRWGMGSIGIYIANNEAELRIFHERILQDIRSSYLRFESAGEEEASVLVQEFLSGVEYGMDVVNDLTGENAAVFVKEKLAMRSGETDAAVTVDDPQIASLGRRLAVALQHVGNLDVDLFRRDGEVFILELNNRFGGGYPFSHLAGADIPRAIVSWLRGITPDPRVFEITPGVVGVKDMTIRSLKHSQPSSPIRHHE